MHVFTNNNVSIHGAVKQGETGRWGVEKLNESRESSVCVRVGVSCRKGCGWLGIKGESDIAAACTHPGIDLITSLYSLSRLHVAAAPLGTLHLHFVECINLRGINFSSGDLF
jgi:hypothetical protein